MKAPAVNPAEPFADEPGRRLKRGHAATSTRAAAATRSPSGPGGSRMELLEREPFLATLAEYAADARRGSGLVLVSGESGIGKTALLEAFQRRSPELRWLWGGCERLTTPRPLGPLFDIAAQASGELASLATKAGTPRDRLFAAFLADRRRPGRRRHDRGDGGRALGRRSHHRPAELPRPAPQPQPGPGRGHLPGPRDLATPFRLVLGDLATQRGTRRMQLSPLTPSAVRALAGPRDVDAAELHRVTGGDPFYVIEVLDAGWPSVPPRSATTVAARLARARAATRQAIEAAAVLGPRVDAALLAALVPDPGPATTAGLDSGILATDGTGLRFRHELVRMAVEVAISPLRQAELHAALLAALEQRGDSDPALLAHHVALRRERPGRPAARRRGGPPFGRAGRPGAGRRGAVRAGPGVHRQRHRGNPRGAA